MEGPDATRYEWDGDDWRAAAGFHQSYLAHREAKSAWPVFLVKADLLAVVATVGYFRLPSKMPPGVRWLVIVGVAVVGYHVAAYLPAVVDAVRWAGQRGRRRSSAAPSRHVEWGWDPERVWFHTELAEVAYRWVAFQAVVEAPRCFLFYERDELLLWVPARGFASAGSIRRFAELARTRVAHYVVLGECQFSAKPEPIGLDEL